MPTKKNIPIPDVPSRLKVSRSEAETKINSQIDKGQGILKSVLNTSQDVENLANTYNKWNDFNNELISVLFSGNRVEDDYKRHTFVSYSMNGSIREKARIYIELTAGAIRELESIVERLPLISEENQGIAQVATRQKSVNNKNVFLVHGHDNGLKQEVARFLEKLNLNPVILHEQANEGNTLIEKFEKHSEVGFAVVLLTPDDFGGAVGGDSHPRARQNVILELGYFLGALNRKRVCALYVKDVELPSDLSGVLYVPVDEHEAWKMKLAKEIKVSGIDVDLNLVM